LSEAFASTPLYRSHLRAAYSSASEFRLSPGAAECGVGEFIDRLLAGDLAPERAAFLEGLAAIDAYARRAQGAAFADLSVEKRDQVISAMEDGSAEGFANAGALFVRMRQLTLWGMFSDPFYGGNRNFAGWDLIRYPGPRVAVAAGDQEVNVSPQPYRRSAYGAQSSR
jgi:gluconate 2-dehydrogenase gamma chain